MLRARKPIFLRRVTNPGSQSESMRNFSKLGDSLVEVSLVLDCSLNVLSVYRPVKLHNLVQTLLTLKHSGYRGRRQPRVPNYWFSPQVASRLVCRFQEGPTLPAVIEVAEDGIDDPATAPVVVEAGHGSGPASHLPEASLNDICGADLPRMLLGAGEEAQQFLQSLRRHSTALGASFCHLRAQAQ